MATTPNDTAGSSPAERPNVASLEAAYGEVLSVLGVPLHEGILDTPRRAARALAEMTSGYFADVEALCTTFDKGTYDQMVTIADNDFSSICEHHLLPFTGKAHVVYLPSERVIGMSKVPRLIDAFAHRLQIQERMTEQIADALDRYLAPHGVLVMVEASHSCCGIRGVKKPGTVMRTQALRGSMLTDSAQRAEAIALLG